MLICNEKYNEQNCKIEAFSLGNEDIMNKKYLKTPLRLVN